jgi:hypothetical protein
MSVEHITFPFSIPDRPSPETISPTFSLILIVEVVLFQSNILICQRLPEIQDGAAAEMIE